ncbi:H-type lectin domain-containing protein [Clostridium sp. cpc1]|uniref:H-type lectin domain-containing protein n=1 Tax=Clostridium sp. cpc1 TaxID=2016536 RepID=UPI002240E1B8|nr:H-type lectin domain-containing protein [Clostridium sp. cpc1]
MSGLDIIKNHNARVKVYVDNVTNRDFTLCIHTWSDSEIYGVGVSWMAYGE